MFLLLRNIIFPPTPRRKRRTRTSSSSPAPAPPAPAEKEGEQEDSAEAILAIVNAIEEEEEAEEPLEHPLAPADDNAIDPNEEAPDKEATTHYPDCGYESNKGNFKHVPQDSTTLIFSAPS